MGIWVWVLSIIPKKSGYLGMGIEYYTQKKWVFGYGYWVRYPYHTQYPKKTGYGCMILNLKNRLYPRSCDYETYARSILVAFPILNTIDNILVNNI